jgi:three-Cys-motif partner protein
MSKTNPKTNLLDHSEAKVNLYGRYLSIYLNILHRAGFVKRIFLFDLFCGEGIYENDAEGSPIIALHAIRNHYFANKQTCPNLTIWFNDNGKSEIEDGIDKIDRVQRISSKMFIPPNVDLYFSKEDYREKYPKAVEEVKKTRDAKGLFFIDPFGYKVIKPTDLRQILQLRDTEVILWLPIAQMYRFAGSVKGFEFPGSEPLRGFLQELFGEDIPTFHSSYDFIEQLKVRFRAYLKDLHVYVNTFTLERDAKNIYCLFFFTSHVKGYEAMLSAKWDMDKEHGKGFTLQRAPMFFSEIELSGYQQKVRDFISGEEYRLNSDLYLFGLENDFLPKHTKSVLDILKKDEPGFEIFSFDGKPARSYYIGDSNRRVGIRLRTGL